MRPGTHAAADGSFGRSAGAAMGRGVLLLAIALVIGIVLLNATDDQPPGTDVAAGSSSNESSEGGGDGDAATATTTTAPPTTLQAARNPAEVKVLIANASDVRGAAGGARTKLLEAKYNVLSPTDSPTKGSQSAVYFTAEYQADAAAVAAALQIPADLVKPLPTPAPVPDLKTANVLVVLGTDHAPRFGTAPAGAATTTTTAAGAATSTTTTTR